MEKKENRFQIISAIAAVVLLYLVLEGFGITCPIKFLTGISSGFCTGILFSSLIFYATGYITCHFIEKAHKTSVLQRFYIYNDSVICYCLFV